MKSQSIKISHNLPSLLKLTMQYILDKVKLMNLSCAFTFIVNEHGTQINELVLKLQHNLQTNRKKPVYRNYN